MLKIEIDEGKTSVTVAGSLDTVIRELAELVANIYNQIREQDRTAALLFRCGMKTVIADEKAPVWADREPPKAARKTAVVVDEKNVTTDDLKKIVDGGASMDELRAFLEAMC